MTHQKDFWTIWRLNRGLDRRFRAGHPWVYSNELKESPKGLAPGAPVELHDAGGKFLARGYGNPKSLISFRALTRSAENEDALSVAGVVRSLTQSGKLRSSLGMKEVSHRLCFGEADFLPGLVVDRYAIPAGQVFVVQAHTAGADRWVSSISQILEGYVNSEGGTGDWNRTGIILRNDLSVRKLEGLEEEEPRVIKELSGVNFRDLQILVASAEGGKPLSFQVDLLKGQKTGFFLDQAANIQLAILRLKHLFSKKVRILDLCCYVGQWGAQFARAFTDAGIQVEVVSFDASAQALELARKNALLQGASCESVRGDVLKDLDQFADQSFDIVISDPPALIKNRKDIPAGTHAYLQLATQVFRLVRTGGGVVCCSCSALLEEESFTQVLTKAAVRNQVQVQWIGRGAQSPDHPMLTEFPEGRYLKGWVGRVSR
jgi:23S rRNA (cytosine1962-C5)-methyltransferase